MHEIVFSRKIIDAVNRKAGSKKIKYVLLEVGEVAGITALELKNKVKELTGWNVRAKSINAKIKCSCKYNGRPEIVERLHDSVIYSCPKCETFMPKLVSGDQIKVKEVGVEDVSSDAREDNQD